MKIISVVGARPQFVKAAVISRAIKEREGLTEIIVHTGQHFDPNMSEIFFEEMEIPKPNYNLNINSLGHGAMTGKMMIEMEKLFISEQPDFVLVYGDTNSTLAAAIVAKKLHLKLVHIEAGVRNFNIQMPEEINRILVDRVSDFNFTCTNLGTENLKKEGFFDNHIQSDVYEVGDVMYDAALYYGSKSAKSSSIMRDLNLEKGNFVLSTVHRAENTDDYSKLKAINDLLEKVNSEYEVVLPLHPRTKNKLIKYKLKSNYNLIDPVGYFSMLELIKSCKYVITDSGGVVREAYFFNKPSLSLFEQPVWPELVSKGYCVSCAPEFQKLIEAYRALKDVDLEFEQSMYGNGNSGDLIINILVEYYNKNMYKKKQLYYK